MMELKLNIDQINNQPKRKIPTRSSNMTVEDYKVSDDILQESPDIRKIAKKKLMVADYMNKIR